MFFDDPIKAFSNIFNALKPSGELSFVCWQGAEENPWQSDSMQILSNHIDIPKLPVNAPGPFAFSDPNYIKKILNTSGFKKVVIENFKSKMILFPEKSTKEAVIEYIAINPTIKDLIQDVSHDIYEKIIDDMTQRFSTYYLNNDTEFPAAAWVVSGMK